MALPWLDDESIHLPNLSQLYFSIICMYRHYRLGPLAICLHCPSASQTPALVKSAARLPAMYPKRKSSGYWALSASTARLSSTASSSETKSVTSRPNLCRVQVHV